MNSLQLRKRIEKIKYDVNNIYETELYEDGYKLIKHYIDSKETVYNEAKPSLINYDINSNEEDGK